MHDTFLKICESANIAFHQNFANIAFIKIVCIKTAWFWSIRIAIAAFIVRAASIDYFTAGPEPRDDLFHSEPIILSQAFLSKTLCKFCPLLSSLVEQKWQHCRSKFLDLHESLVQRTLHNTLQDFKGHLPKINSSHSCPHANKQILLSISCPWARHAHFVGDYDKLPFLSYRRMRILSMGEQEARAIQSS